MENQNHALKDVRTHYINYDITDSYARTLQICLGCGGLKGCNTVVCWHCFKSRADLPLKYFDGTFKEWLIALNQNRVLKEGEIMAENKRLENDSQILTAFFKRWLFPEMHEQPIDFYSARMLAYNLCQSLGLDAERIYKIKPGTYRNLFQNAGIVSAYMAGIIDIEGADDE